jgi:hypothetical protein
VSVEVEVTAEVGGSVGEGMVEISESQNKSGDLEGSVSSPVAFG